MSDPVTNVEIEDVLSSIRRLVSEENRAEPSAKPVETPPEPERDKLVLTPALRVADPVNDAVEDEMTETAEPEIAEPVDAEAPWKNPDATLYEAAAAVEIQDDEELEEHRGEESEQPEPGIVENDEAEEEWDGSFEPGAMDAPEPDAEDRPLSDRIAELEARIGETQDQWEPDGTGTDDYAGTDVETMAWQDHVEDEDAPEDARPEPLDPARYVEVSAAEELEDEDDAEDDLGILSGDDTFLDEESLRELVADIVRQELQGALGERITRNVRKLVRREIHRALTAQELD